ncbi:MAG: metallophosphoesterase [Deltaproteobacteria bacterium]|nr:metallophosphoesterase [Deltaproteobacteria bacterium]
MTTLTHISDFHLPIEGRVPRHKLFSKRILGYANLRFNRGKTHMKQPFIALLEHLFNQHADMCVATGDFVNLALSSEFAHLASIFEQTGFTDKNLFCIPGNHDRYTPGAQLRKDFETHFHQWLPFDNAQQAYPTFKIVGSVALIGVNTATWRGPVRAAGRIDKSQRQRIEQRLNTLPSGLTPVIAMHHPPFAAAGHMLKQYLDGLQHFEPLVAMLQGRNAVVIHGHIHVLSDRTYGDVRIIGVPSASNDTGTDRRQLGYNTLKFDAEGLKEAACTQFWPATNTFRTFQLNETRADL